MKSCIRLFLPLSAVVVVSSTLAYALDVAIVGASTNSSIPAEVVVAAPVATSDPLLSDTRRTGFLESCLTAWRYVSVENPQIYAAGFEQFIDSGCSAPSNNFNATFAGGPTGDARADARDDWLVSTLQPSGALR